MMILFLSLHVKYFGQIKFISLNLSHTNYFSLMWGIKSSLIYLKWKQKQKI